MNESRKFISLTLTLNILCCLMAGCSQKASEQWKVPDNPNPQAILYEAERDTDAGHYENALAKQVWYHENALRIEPSQYGVRLSFALSAWTNLAKSYPAALEKLKSVRDEAAKDIRGGKASRDLFNDFEAINEHLEEDDKTKDMFLWLDANNPSFASLVFDIAQPALIKAKQYQICGKYIDADASFQRILKLYRMNKQLAEKRESGKDLREFGDKAFSHGTATLVALLTVNGRKDEAVDVEAKALKERDDPEFKAQLEKAKNGEFPAAWP